MSDLKISADLSLPLDVAGEAIAILATRGAGKSYTSASLVEELYGAGVQTVVIDPAGVYWGLRSSAKGIGGGLPIIVLGGVHGDVPLEATAGKVIADLIVDTGQSLVLDLSDFESDTAQARFMTDFADRLYRRKARSRTTVHLVVDEADEFAPQKPQKGEERMLHAMVRLVRRGRSRGIGLTLITQRSASISKNALDLVETLVVMRMLGPRDRDAISGWIKHKHLDDEIGVLDSLPSLPTGTAWVWSPLRRVLKKVAMRRIETFDSYKTPKPGEQRVEPKTLAPVDLAKLGEQIKATVERAKNDDPKLLREELSRARAELAKRDRAGEAKTSTAAPKVNTEEIRQLRTRVQQQQKALEAAMKFITTVRTIGFPDKIDAKKLETAITAAVQRVGDQINTEFGAKRRAFDKWQADGEKLLASVEALLKAEVPIDVTVKHNEPFSVAARAPAQPAPAPRTTAQPMEGVSRSQQKILESLAMLESMGIAQPSRTQLALWSEVSSTSGGYFNNLGALRTGGLIDYPAGGTVALTDAGRARTPTPEPLSVEEMQTALCARVGASKAAILRALIEIYPEQIKREELAKKISVSPTSGGYFNNLGALRTLGVIDYPTPGFAVALPVLFLEVA